MHRIRSVGRGRKSEKAPHICCEGKELASAAGGRFARLRVGNFISTSAVFLPLRPLMFPLSTSLCTCNNGGPSHGSHCRSFALKDEKISANASSKFHLTRQLDRPLLLPSLARRQKWQITPFREVVLLVIIIAERLAFHLSTLPLSPQGISPRCTSRVSK